jgi:hypothetical protein
MKQLINTCKKDIFLDIVLSLYLSENINLHPDMKEEALTLLYSVCPKGISMTKMA